MSINDEMAYQDEIRDLRAENDRLLGLLREASPYVAAYQFHPNCKDVYAMREANDVYARVKAAVGLTDRETPSHG